MYKVIRNIHLLLGVSAVAFILVYAVSAVQMAHQFAIKPRISEEDLVLPPGLEARPLAQMLMDQHGYRGDLNNVRTENGRLKLTIARPGTNCAIDYDPASGRARVERRALPVMGLLNRLHHLNGFGHSNRSMNAWGWILAWISATLLLLGATGLYMWFRLYKERLIGSVLLGLNLVVSIVLLFMLRL